SIKHAFKKEGHIKISIIKGSGGNFKLIYTDNGTWLEPQKDYTGFGLGLIETLAEQLEGSFTRNESEYTFTIRNLDN
ncbi:MAG: sensor histidine kinase, partial [Flavobacteriales bacterium]|nr:sensor histidine kinase [Flavobacteriales bacterium]